MEAKELLYEPTLVLPPRTPFLTSSFKEVLSFIKNIFEFIYLRMKFPVTISVYTV